ncbi:pilus assembly protein TadG-related protein [Vibrio hepatarius]|uniref:pilus assembly protein TadG-related protein n=1 Tax=Vibrio hepatarius TaxID=171383 RepID=UPI00142DE163|nr:pilus assembly protein TadG-related protein [Vibrio hepatarius]NIY82703.1 hypothetical protein [Vibrio hepatarius]
MMHAKQTLTMKSQQGITLVLVSLLMLILIGMAAFVIDLNHQVLNKTRLQNAVDAAALASAVVADKTSNVYASRSAAIDTLNSYVSESGNAELVDLLGVDASGNSFDTVNANITFSTDLQTFVTADAFVAPTGTRYDIYTRVVVDSVPLTQYLSFIFGGDKDVSASAVAGRSASIQTTCNIAPVAMCGNPALTDETAWGYVPSSYPNYDSTRDKIPETIYAIKPSSHKTGELGPGNFHLLDLGLNGKDGVRDAFAGATENCITVGQNVDTETGKGTGPVAQGINTRFGDFTGPTEEGETVKSDKYIEESNVTESNYEDIYQNNKPGAFYYADYYQKLNSCIEGNSCDSQYYDADGLEGRRLLQIPIIDCSASTGGNQAMPVLGFGCFFLTQKVKQKGNESEVIGQFLHDCGINNGSTGIDPSDNGLFRIQLYKDPLGNGAS